MIVYSPKAVSLIKGRLLSKLKNSECRVKEEMDSIAPQLFSNASLDADEFCLDTLIGLYRQQLGCDLSWLKTTYGTRLLRRLDYALKNSAPRKYVISQQALDDALQYGPEYCLNNVSPASRQLYRLASQVYHEVHRMLGFIRFQLLDDKTLVAEPKLFHDTGPLILKKFRPRYPGYSLILVLQDTALGLKEDNHFFSTDPWPLRQLLREKDAYCGIWQDYYKSQYIQSRKNIALAQKAIPQKYWDWLEEGNILAEEKKKPPSEG